MRRPPPPVASRLSAVFIGNRTSDDNETKRRKIHCPTDPGSIVICVCCRELSYSKPGRRAQPSNAIRERCKYLAAMRYDDATECSLAGKIGIYVVTISGEDIDEDAFDRDIVRVHIFHGGRRGDAAWLRG